MPTIATMFNSGLPPYSMTGYTTKTVQGSYLKNGFSNKWSGQGTSHCHMETPLDGRPEDHRSPLNKAGNPFSQGILQTLRYATPGPLGPLSERS